MPSTQLFVQSGGQLLVSGNITSGQLWPLGGLFLRNDVTSPSGYPVYIGLPNLSGTIATFASGGNLSSGGLADGWPLYPGDKLVVPKSRLVSGLMSIQLLGPTQASGARIYWDFDLRGE